MPYEEDEYTKLAREALQAAQTIPSLQYQGNLDDMARDMNTAQMIQSGRRQTRTEEAQNISNLRTQLESNQELQNQARNALSKMQTDYTNLTGRTDYQDAIKQNLRTATRDQYDELAEQILAQYNAPSLGSGGGSSSGRRSGGRRSTVQNTAAEPESKESRVAEMKLKKLQNRSEKRLERIGREQEQKQADAAKYASDQLEKGTELVYKDAVKNGKVDDKMYNMLTDEQKQAVNAKLSQKTDTKKLKRYDGSVQQGRLGPSDLEAEAYNPKVVNQRAELPRVPQERTIGLNKSEEPVQTGLRKSLEEPVQTGLRRSMEPDILPGLPGNALGRLNNNSLREYQEGGSGRSLPLDTIVGSGRSLPNEEPRQTFYDSVMNSNEKKLERWSSPDYKLSAEEEAEAKKMSEDYFKENFRGANQQFVGNAEDQQNGTVEAMSALYNKTHKTAAFGSGLLGSLQGLGTMLSDAASGLIRRLGGDNTADAIQALDESINQSIQGARTQHPLVSGAGTMAGKVGQYSAINSALEAAGVTPALEQFLTQGRDLGATGNALAGVISRLGVGELADIALDTIPTEYNNARNGMSFQDILNDTYKNLGENMAYNVFGEVMSEVPGLIGDLRNTSPDEILKAAGTLVDDGSIRSIADQSFEQIPSIAKSADGGDILKNANIGTDDASILARQTGKPVDDIQPGAYDNNIGGVDDGIRTQTLDGTGNARDLQQSGGRGPESGGQNGVWGQEQGNGLESSQRSLVNEVTPELRQVFNESGVNDLQLRNTSDNLESFCKNLDDNRISNEHGAFVDSQTPEQLVERGAKVFSSPNGKATVAVCQNGDIIAVCRHAQGEKGAVSDLLLTARANGGDRLDCYGKDLVDKYARNGFEPVARVKYTYGINEEMDEYCRAMKELYGDEFTEPEIYFMKVRDGESIEQTLALKRAKQTPVYDDDYLANLPEKEYTAAEEYRDGLIDAYKNSQNSGTVDSIPGLETADTNGNILDALQKEAADITTDGQRYYRKSTGEEVSMEELYDLNRRMEEAKRVSEIPNIAQTTGAPEQAVKTSEETAQSMNRSMAENIDTTDTITGKVPEAEGQRISEGTGDTMSSGNQFGEPEIPEGNVERGFAESMRERGNIPDEIKQGLTKDPLYYKRLGNKQTAEKAINLFQETKTFDEAEKTLTGLIDSNDAAAALYAKQLVTAYSQSGQTEAAMKVMDQISSAMTQRGQFTQAAVLALAKDDPMTALQYAQRQIDKLNADGAAKYGKKWKDFSLNEDELKAFGELKPGDEKGIKDLFDKVGERIGRDYPATFAEKFIEGRRVSMLFNVRTNVRNLGANLPTEGMRYVADRLEGLGQKAYKLFHPNYEPSAGKAVAAGMNDAQSRDLAKQVMDGDYAKGLFEGDAGKYSDPNLRGSIMQNRVMYKGTRVEKFLDRITGGGIQKINKKVFGKENIQSLLETTRNATYGLLELGDSPFVKANFQQRLASYIKASGITDVEQVPQEAIDFAWEEAMKATYKDNSWAMSQVSKVKNAIASTPVVGKTFSDAVIPFVQAPANIAARMVDYSPIRGTKGLVDIIQGSKNVDYDQVTKGIEEMSKGLTGSGLVVAGIALHNAGILTGSYSEDKDERAAQKRQGFREYALHVGDKYFTYDWMQPAAQSLIMGTILADSINQSDKINDRILNELGEKVPAVDMAGTIWATTKKAAKASINSWFNASPLQSLAELIGTSGYGSYEADLGGGIGNLVQDYPLSYIPAALGATARGTDPTVRNATDKTSALATLKNQAMARIPGLSDNLPASYDTWGNEYTRGNNVIESLLSQYVVPGEFTTDTSTDRDKEIDRVFQATDENKVFPRVADTSVDGRKLTNNEVSDYQRDMGQRNAQLIDSLFNQDFYANMSDSDKADTIASLYSFSKGYSENALFEKPLSSTNAKLAEVYDNAGGGEAGANALINYMSVKNRSTNEKGNVTNKTAVETLSQMTPEEQAANAPYLFTNPSEKALAAAERFDNGLYMFYAINEAAIATEEGATAISQERLKNLLDDDEALAAVNGGQTMTQEEKAAWYDAFYPDAKSGNPYGKAASTKKATPKETTNTPTESQTAQRHQPRPDKGQLTAEVDWPYDWDPAKSKSYRERFATIPKIDNSVDAYKKMFIGMDADNSGYLTPEEAQNYLDANNYSRALKEAYFRALGQVYWSNPYVER